MTNLAYSYEDERRPEMLDGVIYMMATPGLKCHLVPNAVYKIFNRHLRGKKCMAFSDGLKVFLTELGEVFEDVRERPE